MKFSLWFFFMEKPGIEPATPGLQGIALIHYTTGGMCDQQGSDQQAHMDSLVRAFASCLNILRLLSY